MEQLLVITAVGNDHTGAVQTISRIILECGATIRESRMTALGAEFAMLMLVAGNWHSISRLEQDLGRYDGTEGLTIYVRRTSTRQFHKELLPYAIDVVCLDQPGIVHHLVRILCRTQDRDRRSHDSQLSGRAHGNPHVFGSDVCEHSRGYPHFGYSGGVHGVLRPAQSGCHHGTREDCVMGDEKLCKIFGVIPTKYPGRSMNCICGQSQAYAVNAWRSRRRRCTR